MPRTAPKPLVLCERHDGKMFKMPLTTVKLGLDVGKPARFRDQILADLRRVEADLSPENVSGDGELPLAQVRLRHAELMRERFALCEELGGEPTDDELYPTRVG